MSLIAKIADGGAGGESRIFAYGFDAAGFPIQSRVIPFKNLGIEFKALNDSESLEKADGVIVPQGVFERIQSERSMFGPKTRVAVDPSLLERERQVFNLLRDGKWICFLVGDVLDEVAEGMHREPIRDTDLCKRLLNAFTVERRHRYRVYGGTPPEMIVREREFETYALRYGAPTTVFELPRFHPVERRILVGLGDRPVGIEFDAQLFFLPFLTEESTWPTAVAVAETVAEAVTRYRSRRIAEIPAWVDALRFKTEKDLYREINALLEKVNRLESELLSWRDYKSVLTISETNLRDKIVAILENVFHLRMVVDEERPIFIKDARDRRRAVLMDVQSTPTAVERDSIERTIRLRRSHSLPDSFPAVLFVNSHRSVSGIADRIRAGVPPDSVRYAKEHNVLVVRTIDFLLLVQRLEKDAHRREKLMDLLLSGGGGLVETSNFAATG